jgi:hypothetical protein
MRKKSGLAAEELDFERLSQVDAAELFSVSVRTLNRWEREHRQKRGFPRNKDGTYHHQALIWWLVANKIGVAGRR